MSSKPKPDLKTQIRGWATLIGLIVIFGQLTYCVIQIANIDVEATP